MYRDEEDWRAAVMDAAVAAAGDSDADAFELIERNAWGRRG